MAASLTLERGRIDERLTIYTVDTGEASLADDVARGLTAERKYLRPKHFYDELGSILFEAITLLPEYYLTRAESEILRRSSGEILDAVGLPLRLIELGSGSSVKTRTLIEALLERQKRLHYLPIDISESALERSANELLQRYPGLSITGHAADYSGGMRAIFEESRHQEERQRTLVLFLGSTIGNLELAAAEALLADIRRALEPGDALLLGADLVKAEELLVAAYDDAHGVTPAFDRNILARINTELDANFDLAEFDHVARWNPEHRRMEMFLVSRCRQRVRIAGLDLEIELAAGEGIHTESSHKYDLDGLSELAAASGFERAETWLDRQGYFSVSLMRAVEG